jgi:GTP-binding protein Era
MVQEALRVVSDVDLVLLLVDAARPEGKEEHSILQTLREKGASVLLGINKIDLVPKPSLLALMASFNERFPFAAIVPISALTGDGVDTLEGQILRHLPAGPQYFPEDQLTDLPERFLAGEVVREKVFHLCGEEIPYAVAVVVEEYREQEPPRPVFIRATLYVERGSQRGILIGAGGGMLKRIGKAAREELQGLLERSVYLELWVKVEKNWSRDERAMRRLGYR